MYIRVNSTLIDLQTFKIDFFSIPICHLEMLLRWQFYNIRKLIINFLFCNICILFLILHLTNEIAHDSLKCEQFQNCSDVSHVILRLHKRDDKFAHSFASKYDMQIMVCFFLITLLFFFYFIIKLVYLKNAFRFLYIFLHNYYKISQYTINCIIIQNT